MVCSAQLAALDCTAQEQIILPTFRQSTTGMKTRFTLFLLVCTTLLWAEPIPQGYYNHAQGLKDSLLKAALHDSICMGWRVHYGTQGYTYPDSIYYTGTWNYLPQTDQRPDGTIWDMYSNTQRYFPANGGSGCGVEIEHCLPKSWWGWTTNSSEKTDSIGYRAYRDLYHLTPADGSANGNKSNFPPGHVQKGDKFDNGSFRMDAAKSSQYGYICFEPAEEYRGDFARAYFYIATAYQNLHWDASKCGSYIDSTSYLLFRPQVLQVLLDWHRADPVSRKEIERADAVSTIQHNRNPFIDHPDLVDYIWGNKQGQAVDFSTLTCTASADYVPTPNTKNLRAYEATDTTHMGFTAQWQNLQTDYTLDVYTYSTTGKNDTLVSMPAITEKLLNATPYMGYTGRINNTGSGTNAITMGVSDTDGAVVLHGLGLTREATLSFRASMYKTATTGELQIFFGENTTADTVITLPTSRDEVRYSLILPAGTDSVTILSVGGSTKKRACMQELYLVQGDLSVQQNSVKGYPKAIPSCGATTNFCTEQVTLPADHSYEQLYYRLTTSSGTRSNEVCVLIPKAPTALPDDATLESSAAEAKKILRNGQILILRSGQLYDLFGHRR